MLLVDRIQTAASALVAGRHRSENSVDEVRGLIRREFLGHAHGLRDGHRGGNLRALGEFEHRDTQDRPVDTGHAGQVPAGGVCGDEPIDIRLVIHHAGHQRHRIVVESGFAIGFAAALMLPEYLLNRNGLGVRLEQYVQSPLSCLASS